MTANRKIGITLAFILLIISTIAAGCGNSASNATSSSSGSEQGNASGQQSDPSVKGGANGDTGVTIKLYGNDFVDEVAPRFTEDTGYKMEAVHYGGGEALAKIEAEQGNPQWDVLMMDGHGSVQNLADRGFLMTGWVPDNIGNLNDFGASMVPSNDAYFPIGMHASAVIAYNKNLVSEADAPKAWEEFFNYKGPVGHADPAVAAPAYPLVSSFFYKWGVEEAKAKYEKRFKDGLFVYPKNGPVGKALLSGEIQVAALQEGNAYQMQLDGEPVGVIWPDEGAPGSLRVIAINKETKNPAAAKAFVEYMLKPETQNYLTSLSSNESFFTPLSKGAKMRKERRQDGTFLLPPASWAGEHETEIKTWFADRNVN
ncbi:MULTISPECIES: extracellular solute-binding protein [Paenibacillus]|uniref:ABC transporter substrate-binding protein n=1 Tax=Paenibacillus lautus TaxID=1401 RepID=A0A1R1ANL4_PAELA|nr:extracellular solute-binding protein [Paenibacillus lautus]OME87070.1 ABC transporter substrate-binding protein [Paenibacillus lautus]